MSEVISYERFYLNQSTHLVAYLMKELFLNYFTTLMLSLHILWIDLILYYC